MQKITNPRNIAQTQTTQSYGRIKQLSTKQKNLTPALKRIKMAGKHQVGWKIMDPGRQVALMISIQVSCLLFIETF